MQKVSDLEALELLLEAAALELGFRHYAMIHHDDARVKTPGLIHMQNYPAVYAERYVAGQLHRIDPVVHTCHTASASFCWSDIGELIALRASHRRFLEAGAREGVADGITVPAYVLGERSGSCNFSGPLRPEIVRRSLGAVQLVGSFAFQAARRIILGVGVGGGGSGPGSLREVRSAGLRPRERECIILAGHGKSNEDIGTILGLSAGTVKNYIASACARYRVHNRTQVLIAAAIDGEVGIHEVAPRQYCHLAR